MLRRLLGALCIGMGFAVLFVPRTMLNAQETTCGPSIKQALQIAAQVCTDLKRNQACLGNPKAEVVAKAGASLSFAKSGDTINLADVESFKLSPFNAKEGTWGVALLRVQGNLPDTAVGQNVTLIVFGNVELQNAATAGQTPMQAMYLRTGAGEPACKQLPPDGMLMQHPKGSQRVQMTVNGVDMRIGSTVFISVTNDPIKTNLTKTKKARLQFKTLEGKITITVNGKSVNLPAGTQSSVPVEINEDGTTTLLGPASEVLPLTDDDFSTLPFSLLPDEVETESIPVVEPTESVEPPSNEQATDIPGDDNSTSELDSTPVIDSSNDQPTDIPADDGSSDGTAPETVPETDPGSGSEDAPSE